MPLDWRKDRRYAHLTEEQVRRHYEEERSLRRQLLAAPPDKRADTFLWAYDELFRRCPWHPALTETSGPTAEELIERRSKWIYPLLGCGPAGRVLEIGCGNGELMIGLARLGLRCVGIDVSHERIAKLRPYETESLRFLECEGSRLPFSSHEFDAAISMQLFEHLHPDDVPQHLAEVHRVLRPGGRYLIETPNRPAGPQDVSRFFTEVAAGFHLREYSLRDMADLLGNHGYRIVGIVLRQRRLWPARRALMFERIWSLLPKPLRRRRTFGLGNPLYIAEAHR